jgi:hypothetical protein
MGLLGYDCIKNISLFIFKLLDSIWSSYFDLVYRLDLQVHWISDVALGSKSRMRRLKSGEVRQVLTCAVGMKKRGVGD